MQSKANFIYNGWGIAFNEASSSHVDNRKYNFLVLGEGPTDDGVGTA